MIKSLCLLGLVAYSQAQNLELLFGRIDCDTDVNPSPCTHEWGIGDPASQEIVGVARGSCLVEDINSGNTEGYCRWTFLIENWQGNSGIIFATELYDFDDGMNAEWSGADKKRAVAQEDEEEERSRRWGRRRPTRCEDIGLECAEDQYCYSDSETCEGGSWRSRNGNNNEGGKKRFIVGESYDAEAAAAADKKRQGIFRDDERKWIIESGTGDFAAIDAKEVDYRFNSGFNFLLDFSDYSSSSYSIFSSSSSDDDDDNSA